MSARWKGTNALILLPVLAVVAVSGCIGGPGPVTGPGVTIIDFSPDIADPSSGDEINLLLKVQNQGGSRARNVVAEVINIDLTEWGGFGQQQLQLGTLIAADPVTSTPGETKTATFQSLRAPALSRGTSFAYQPAVRVSYDYTTTAQKPITIVDKNELVKIKQQGQSLPGKPTTVSAGPLNVEIIMGNFIRTSGTFGTSQTYDIFPVQIKISNSFFGSGGSVTPKGFIGGPLFGTGATYPVLVKVTPPTGTNFIFSGGFGGGQDCSNFQVPVELFKGQQAEITCELEVTSPPTVRSESLIIVELDYRYFIDRVTQVTVAGTKDVGGLF